jgi:hypothetical protein
MMKARYFKAVGWLLHHILHLWVKVVWCVWCRREGWWPIPNRATQGKER